MEDQKQRVYDALDKLKIKYEVVEHEPVYTMEDMDRLYGQGTKVLLDIKGLLDRREYETAGYSYWRL